MTEKSRECALDTEMPCTCSREKEKVVRKREGAKPGGFIEILTNQYASVHRSQQIMRPGGNAANDEHDAAKLIGK